MMGRSHGAIGLAIGMGVARIAGFSPGVDLAFGAICAGASLLPDLDEPGSTVSHVLEPVSGAVSYALARVCDGHRKASHSLIGVALVVGLASGLRELGLWHHITLLAPLIGFLYACDLRLVSKRKMTFNTLFYLVVAFALGFVTDYYLISYSALWPLVAIGIGVTIHLVADWLATGGVPFFWPWSHRFELPLFGRTNSYFEHIVGWLAVGIGVTLAVAPTISLWLAVRAAHITHLHG